MKTMHGDGTEQNHQENEEKYDEDDRRRRRDMYEQINPSNNYENTMDWEDEVIGAEDLLHVDDTLMSYGDFPPLPDFPCISSPSSSSKSCYSSSAPPPTSSVSQRQHHGSVTCRNNSFPSSSATSSASSSASWAVGKSDHKEHSAVDEKTKNQEYHENRYGNLLSTTDSMEIQQDELNRLESGDCMDVMEGFGEIGLFDTDDIWDPSCLFPYEEEEEGFHQPKEDHKCLVDRETVDNDNDGDQEKNNKPSEDLALVFLEWLKSNKETISAEDLRSIKLKRSTIECAAKRLGGGKEGMKQLLKLILEWVQNNHLQKKRLKEGQASSFPSYSSQQQHQNRNPNSHEFSSFTPPESNPACFVPTANPWNVSRNPPPPVVPPSTYVSDPMTSGLAVYPPPPPPPMHGFINGDPSVLVPHFNQSPYPSSEEYMFDASSHLQNWAHHQPPPPTYHFSLSSHPYGASYHHQDPHAHHLQQPPPPPPLSRSFLNYHQNQYQSCHQMFQGSNTTTSDGSLIRLGSSATKEARKKRMARQRKIFSHHQRHAQNNHQTTDLQQTRVSNDTTTTHHQTLNNSANWVFWSPSPPPPITVCGSLSPMMMVSEGPPLTVDPPLQPTQSPPNYHKHINMENRRQGCKPAEKNLKFLLQKVLKQSDVGNLGRIVLPKKEAETYLPELEARDGISIAMEDIGTSRVWNMRYRFWPNNKSRMYLLENTGDFVRSNGLQEGDFIVIYSDIKCGKFMIRGVKVRQPGSKSEAKKSAKANRNLHANSPMCEGPSASMIKQAVA